MTNLQRKTILIYSIAGAEPVNIHMCHQKINQCTKHSGLKLLLHIDSINWPTVMMITSPLECTPNAVIEQSLLLLGLSQSINISILLCSKEHTYIHLITPTSS